MVKIIIHCPINCEKFCFQEITGKLSNISEEQCTLKILDRGILSLEVIIQSPEDLKNWINILNNCFTIEKLRMELKSADIPPEIQAYNAKKLFRVRFLEDNIATALDRLLKISSLHSINLVSNLQHWRDLSQREIQGIFRKVVNEHPLLQFNLKKAEIGIHTTLTPHNLKITIDLPIQTLFSQLKVHPTPVYPSVAYVMVQLGLEQVPQARRFVDAMCGAGNIAIMITQILKDKPDLFVGGFDKDSKWIEIARDNSRILKTSQIEFSIFDLLSNDFESNFPFYNFDLLLAHPPYSHFVSYSNEILEKIYHNLLLVFQKFGCEKACLVINSPRSDIIMPLISKFPFKLLKTIEIPRKATTVKLWVLIKIYN